MKRLTDSQYNELFSSTVEFIIESPNRNHTKTDLLDFMRSVRHPCVNNAALTATQIKNLMAKVESSRRFKFVRMTSRKTYVKYLGI